MAEPTGYLVDSNAFERIAKTVRLIESQSGISESGSNPAIPQDTRTVPLLVTKDAGNGFYEGHYLVPVEDPRAFTGIDGVVYIRGLNGGVLELGRTYHGVLYGGMPHDDGGGNIVNAPLYSVQEGGGGGGVSSVQCTGGELIVVYA